MREDELKLTSSSLEMWRDLWLFARSSRRSMSQYLITCFVICGLEFDLSG